MILKSIGARPIYINTAKPKEGSYLLIPAGEAVEIPDEGINKHVKEYIDGLIESGDVVETVKKKAVEKIEAEPAKRGRKPKEEAETGTETE